MITHSLQSEIDKKSYCALDQDFDTAKLSSRLVTAESCLEFARPMVKLPSPYDNQLQTSISLCSL